MSPVTAPVLIRDTFGEEAEASLQDTASLDLDAAIARACGRIAPLWPLDSFVAVNPFLGFAGLRFEEARTALGRVAGTRMLMPRGFYRAAIVAGRITDQDLRDAIAATGAPFTLDSLAASAQGEAPEPAPLGATFADVVDAAAGTNWSALATGEIAKWCAAYLDDGQSVWRMPFRGKPLYGAWRDAARLDRAPEALGLAGFRAHVAQLPEDATATIRAVLRRLEMPGPAIEDYLHRALMSVNGYAAYLRYRGWEKELAGGRDDGLVQLLAIRLAFDSALHAAKTDRSVRRAWADAAARMAGGRETLPPDADLVLHHAYERAFQRALLADLASELPAVRPARPAVQAAFCIDVRSEVYRRALETVSAEVETIGFAGFFGFPIEYVPLGARHGTSQCPVLLQPRFVVCEAVEGASPAEEERITARRLLSRRMQALWSGFKGSAVTGFSFVETAGLGYGIRLVRDALGIADGAPAPDRLAPRLGPSGHAERLSGIPPEQRIATARAVLRAMSFGETFARLVLLCGHGSTSVNNPHAAGLDCGACGGHSGEANARVAALVLNDPGVREALARDGLPIPQDTVFVAALHDTTTDDIRLFDESHIPASHEADRAALRGWLDRASALARAERAALLKLDTASDLEAAVRRRGQDWSQVRPEWGLAGNAAFIAAPRSRTRGLDLKGRAFLHSYEWRQDEGFAVLELIMTAPMVVASWINLQYFGSTVNNAAFGSGNKVLHNVVGRFGVVQGNGGDLAVGLPWQSVHDGERFVHEPLRLSVVIEAPPEAMDRILDKHPEVRRLVENGWLHLFALVDGGKRVRRRDSRGRWCPP